MDNATWYVPPGMVGERSPIPHGPIHKTDAGCPLKVNATCRTMPIGPRTEKLFPTNVARDVRQPWPSAIFIAAHILTGIETCLPSGANVQTCAQVGTFAPEGKQVSIPVKI